MDDIRYLERQIEILSDCSVEQGKYIIYLENRINELQCELWELEKTNSLLLSELFRTGGN